MGRKNYISGRKKEQGVIITLVAVFMLAVIGAMAALSIDAVTLYTARSEAQLAADAGALAGARALANSGMTSDISGASISSAETLARAVATEVAATNQVGGSYLEGSTAAACAAGNPAGQQICVSFNENAPGDPRVTVTVQRTDLPTFFARLLGSAQLKVTAVATAEAYNPSQSPSPKAPVAPTCVKPWLVPNLSPNSSPASPQIFDATTGTILDTNLIGYQTTGPPNRLKPACSPDCSVGPLPGANPYQYYPGDPTTVAFQPPTESLPSCPAITLPSPYQLSIAGCIPARLACNSQVYIDTAANPTRNGETADAVNCLTHAQNGEGDRYDSAGGAGPPFEFIAGSDNPIPTVSGKVVMVSDSLVTVPVFDVASGAVPSAPVTVIGFLQLFLSPAGTPSPTPPPGALGSMRTKVINLIGCGTNPMGAQPILGNGASSVAVRLISQQ